MFRSAFPIAALLAAALTLLSCGPAVDTVFRTEVQAFLDEYTDRFLELLVESSEAEWASNTRIVEGDDSNRRRTEAANQALSEFTGSVEVIEATKSFLVRRDELEDIQVRQLDRILYSAADNPQTVPEVVTERIAAEAEQVEKLFGFDFRIDGESVSTNQIDDILFTESDLGRRLKAWEASKEVGPVLREGLERLVRLRNGTVQALGYPDYFSYQVSEFDMTTDEMMELNRQLVRELWPLYRQLHTWARYELAERYGADEVPDMLPSHWLPNRWGQEWAQMITVEGIDLDEALSGRTAEWLVKQAEQFYVSLGFDAMPETFWERSSLFPLPPGTPYKKNNHASAWHMDRDQDVRSLMSVVPNQYWWNTTHHELGHIYYYMAYSGPEVPPLLRRGANRAFHEAVGYLLGSASMQRSFLVGREMVVPEVEVDPIRALLKEALDQVPFMPWSAGVMTHFEHDLYAGEFGAESYNARWWDYVERFQGIVPPSPRDESHCDPATKTHINDDAAKYYDYGLAYVIQHQLHAYIARDILGQDPRDTDYFGRRDVGEFLDGILRVGLTRDWRELLAETVGEGISARAMLSYYAPLMAWLEEQNADRTHALPEQPPV
jgi:peptidyl-dipeptidase A